MSTSLENAIKAALNNTENSTLANKAYLEFLKANFIVPIENSEDSEEPQVLFLRENDATYLPVFTDDNYLKLWASDIEEEIKILRLTAVDLLKGIGDDVSVCLDIGTEHYKLFNVAEIQRMRSMILKLFKN